MRQPVYLLSIGGAEFRKIHFLPHKATFLSWWSIVTIMKKDPSQNDFEAMKDMLDRSNTSYITKNEGGRLQIEILTGSCHDPTIMCTFKQDGKFAGISPRY